MVVVGGVYLALVTGAATWASSGGTAAPAATPTASGPATAGVPAGAVRMAAFTAQSGVKVERTGDAGGGQNVGWLASGDWMRFAKVDLGRAGTVTTSVRLAAAHADRPGTVELHLDSRAGRLLASVAVPATGGWQAWRTVTDTRLSPGGRHDVYVVVRSPQAQDFVNLNWFGVAPAQGGTSPSPSTAHSMPASPGTTPSTSPSTASSATPSVTPSVSPSMSGMPGMTPSPGTWLPVDPAAWQAQLAAFQALTPRTPPANAKQNPEFNATCVYSHSAADDPIVFPGQKGASHLHSFIGNDSTTADTTAASLMRFTASSCEPAEDHSAYWIPTLIEHGKAVEPKQVIVYYGSLLADRTKTVPMPNGLRMITGDPKVQTATPTGAVHQFYCAGGPVDGASRSTDGNWPVCAGGTIHFTMRFPDCWDGQHLDSPDHRSHVSFGANGTCPAAFSVRIPSVTFSISYPTSGSADGFRLSSGMASSMHGDAFFAWEPEAMARRVKDCVDQLVTCNTSGQF